MKKDKLLIIGVILLGLLILQHIFQDLYTIQIWAEIFYGTTRGNQELREYFIRFMIADYMFLLLFGLVIIGLYKRVRSTYQIAAVLYFFLLLFRIYTYNSYPDNQFTFFTYFIVGQNMYLIGAPIMMGILYLNNRFHNLKVFFVSIGILLALYVLYIDFDAVIRFLFRMNWMIYGISLYSLIYIWFVGLMFYQDKPELY